MAEPQKITVAIDAETVAQPRDAVVERALNAFLLHRVLMTGNAQSDLSEDEANELAVNEQREARRGRAA